MDKCVTYGEVGIIVLSIVGTLLVTWIAVSIVELQANVDAIRRTIIDTLSKKVK